MNKWETIINHQKSKGYYQEMQSELTKLNEERTIYPAKKDIFRAFDLCKYEDVKVVIIGQDPYHGEGQANGLAFSVPNDIKLPPSLRNIYTELADDLGVIKTGGDLSGWASQGVLLLNKFLTVEKKTPGAHQKLGWDTFTDEIILSLNEHPKPIIYLLWGNFARSLKPLISDKHIIIEGVHPSPLSAYRGFFGSKPFSQINAYLAKNNLVAIDWSK